MNNTRDIIKTRKGFLGIGKPKQNIVLQISDDGLNYDSTLGAIGFIEKYNIASIELGVTGNCQIIKIETTPEYYLDNKLSRVKKKISEVYKKETGADILIFPQDVDMNLSDLSTLLKMTLNK